MQEYPTETRLILVLKEKGQRSLQDLSQDLGISKMGVLNHIKHLESRGLVRRIQKKGRVGRPYYLFTVTEDSKENLANSNAWMLQNLVSYLRETGHSDLMEQFLRDRYEQIRIDYEKRLSHIGKDQKVHELVRMREDE
ncbi:MAG: HTH domain-containing protein, partial [Candidatus Thermoplasmatota archaeon]|nr:HTH domain-containing protein [Candidatus Thermoplasmatota archaeon]